MTRMLTSIFLAGAVLTSVAAYAQEPAQNIGGRHGNLRAAQELVVQAFDRLNVALDDNEGDLGGHAAHAKELLREANDEMKLAAQYANHN